MTHRPHAKYASYSPGVGKTFTTCDECGFIWNMSSMQFQYDFRGGSVPQNTGFLKCPRCLDPLTYQRQLIVIPPDPPMVFNTRPENYAVDEANWLLTESGLIIDTESDEDMITQIPNPSDDASTSNLICSIVAHGGAVATAYLDLFDGNPSSGGASVLSAITGSATRTNIASQLTTTSGIATNTSAISISTSSASTTNISYVGIYNAASGGTLLMSGTVSATPTIASGNPVQFPALGLSINLN